MLSQATAMWPLITFQTLWHWLQGYTKALQEEDYAAAARLRDQGAAGLRGWWVADNKEDPKGHLLRITTGFGRYMGYAYTPQDVAQAEVLSLRWSCLPCQCVLSSQRCAEDKSDTDQEDNSVYLHLSGCPCVATCAVGKYL